MNATVELDGGMRFVGTADTGFEVAMDSSSASGGHNSGPRPMEIVLLGLCSCTAMDVISILRKKRQDVSGLTVKARAETATEHPKVFTNIHLQYIVTGPKVTEQAVARSIQLSLETYCPVNAMLSKTAEVSHSYDIVHTTADV